MTRRSASSLGARFASRARRTSRAARAATVRATKGGDGGALLTRLRSGAALPVCQGRANQRAPARKTGARRWRSPTLAGGVAQGLGCRRQGVGGRGVRRPGCGGACLAIAPSPDPTHCSAVLAWREATDAPRPRPPSPTDPAGLRGRNE
eukprot:scaffold6545_cov323-Prasinococcus_capsulatus_cf.AAC.3